MMDSIFGFEKDLFLNTPNDEKNKYKLVFVFFIVEVLCAFLSGCYMSYMVYPNFYLSIPVGIFFGFIIYSVLKFSLSSVERNHALENDTTKFFSVSFFVTLLISLIFGLFIAFPLSCLIQRSSAHHLVDKQKEIMIDNYQKSQLVTKKNALAIQNKKLSKILNEIKDFTEKITIVQEQLSKDESSNFELELRYNILLKDLTKLKQKKNYQLSQINKSDVSMSVLLAKDFKSFQNSINKAELPLFQLTNISISPVGIAIILSVNFLLVCSLSLLRSLTYNIKYKYSKNVSLFYRKKVIEDYIQNLNECKKLVESKFSYSYDFPSKYDDSPFNLVLAKQSKKEYKYHGLSNYFKSIPIVKNGNV